GAARGRRAVTDRPCHSTQSIACGSTAGIGGSQLESWIENGFADALPANQWYGVKTGETVGPVKHGFEQRVGIPLFFPVFDQVTNAGSQYFFHVIGCAPLPPPPPPPPPAPP